ncbi:pyrroloquinoline quinone biosynthesis peptide chaperone PqqD [Zhongshania aliphaticivorans]|jgi:pyrroloquinoline quinone biosynthesis protein D|uniref:pyrroloquinoline quinone biosynthesis peptide chaperone PqqD n=1 Tax=Zhongshania aliphaticivorans TaxID=1470434 RepID=UPI0012E6DDA4|nr:pyrroloquinoline quinone biosynthesis peptide chaperone PqqD [Zhongshania aliphaticivorans]CAA0116065.1 Coenzyme PQQ synthesis protein D [Zhongshania aliphaticivorans]
MMHADRVTSVVPILSRHFRLQWEPVQDCFVLLYPEGMVKLNASAGEILNACDGKRSVIEISEFLENKYPDADGISGDVIDFFSAAEDKGWTHFV